MTARDDRPRPGFSPGAIAVIIGVGLLVSAVSYVAAPDLFPTAIGVTLGFAVMVAVLNPLAYRHARKHGEWPPKST